MRVRDYSPYKRFTWRGPWFNTGNLHLDYYQSGGVLRQRLAAYEALKKEKKRA